MISTTLTQRAAVVVAFAGAFAATAAQAAAPMAKFQAPGFYRTTLGDFEVTVLNDGTLDLAVNKLLAEGKISEDPIESKVAAISCGSAAGPKMPYHEVTSKPGSPVSATVGTSGSAGERVAVVTASGRSLPALMCGSTGVMVSNDIRIWPPSRSVASGPLPL